MAYLKITDFNKIVKISFGVLAGPKLPQTDFNKTVKICFGVPAGPKLPQTDCNKTVEISFGVPARPKLLKRILTKPLKSVLPRWLDLGRPTFSVGSVSL